MQVTSDPFGSGISYPLAAVLLRQVPHVGFPSEVFAQAVTLFQLALSQHRLSSALRHLELYVSLAYLLSIR